MTNKVFWWVGGSLSVLALAASAGLLLADANISILSGRAAPAISAAPLLLIGTSFLFVQPLIRPRWAELVKNLLLAATFLLWGAVQLMPHGELSSRLGDLVIALYVVDLAWVVLASANSSRRR